jgi:CDP-paratose 2-epimerase
MATVLVPGGAGFVGSSLALLWKRDHPDDRVIALDNLMRHGSELAPARLEAGGVEFVRGDVRHRADLEAVGNVNLVLDCAAEPSVHAGYAGATNHEKGRGVSPAELTDINLTGTLNCLEFARVCGARFVLLSTSRVYPIPALRNLPLEEGADRLFIPAGRSGPGWSEEGITTSFPLFAPDAPGAQSPRPPLSPRSLYGATKLAAEIMVREYAAAFGMTTIVNRCGVLAGPWQMGKVEQGFVALWATRFLYGGPLSYRGFGGTGKQVRDVLHVEDLYALIRLQLAEPDRHAGQVYNAGGGAGNSVSLRELTRLCASITGVPDGRREIGSVPETHPADIPWYVTDNAAVTAATGWTPARSVPEILEDTFDWLRENREMLRGILG